MGDEAIKTAQREVQRLLGTCMLLIQQYERLMKTLVAEAQIQGSKTSLKDNIAASRASVAGKTLGVVVNELFESVVVAETAQQPDVDDCLLDDSPLDENEIWIAARFQLVTPDEDYAQTVRDVKALVKQRNYLVHHFFEHHDLWSADGCATASDELSAAYDQIKVQFDRLVATAKRMDQARREMHAFMDSDAGQEFFVNGIHPDGTVFWPMAGIVASLKMAEKALSENGWTPVNAAAQWIIEREPEQLPVRYGCTSWRQVLHDSRLFDLCKRDVNGQRTSFYRSRTE